MCVYVRMLIDVSLCVCVSVGSGVWVLVRVSFDERMFIYACL